MTTEEVLRLHTEGFNQTLLRQDYSELEKIYSDIYMLVRPDGSVLNKDQVLKDLRQGLTFHSIDMKDMVVRLLGSTAILTAESRTVTSRNGKQSQARFRLVAVYTQEAGAIRLVHFQSTMLQAGEIEMEKEITSPSCGFEVDAKERES
jgi:hypothetical protein